MNQPDEIGAISVPQFCEAYGITLPTFYRLLRDGRVQTIMIGSARRITVAQCREFEAAHADEGITRERLTAEGYALRDEQIRRKRSDGAHIADLAREFELSETRISAIINAETPA